MNRIISNYRACIACLLCYTASVVMTPLSAVAERLLGEPETYIIFMDLSFAETDNQKLRQKKLDIVQTATIDLLEALPSNARVGFYPASCYVSGRFDDPTHREDPAHAECYRPIQNNTKGLMRALKLAVNSTRQQFGLQVKPEPNNKQAIRQSIAEVSTDLVIFSNQALFNAADALQTPVDGRRTEREHIIFLHLKPDHSLQIIPSEVSSLRNISNRSYMEHMEPYDEHQKRGDCMAARYNTERAMNDFYACLSEQYASIPGVGQAGSCTAYLHFTGTLRLRVTPYIRASRGTLASLKESKSIDKHSSARVIEHEYQATLVGRLIELERASNQALRQIVAEEIDLENLPPYHP